jgi:hypothetical protein
MTAQESAAPVRDDIHEASMNLLARDPAYEAVAVIENERVKSVFSKTAQVVDSATRRSEQNRLSSELTLWLPCFRHISQSSLGLEGQGEGLKFCISIPTKQGVQHTLGQSFGEGFYLVMILSETAHVERARFYLNQTSKAVERVYRSSVALRLT